MDSFGGSGEKARYRMPVGFGPAPSPRQRHDGRRWENPLARIRAVSVSFLTDGKRLERLLPDGLAIDGEPVVTIELMQISELQWLAGRGYSTLGVRFPVTHRGSGHVVKGPFLAVLWENLCDPIITGREELGYSKLFCELPQGRVLNDQEHFEAGWQGHRFMEMAVTGLSSAEPTPSTAAGTIHLRYMPSLGRPGEAAIEELTISPPSPTVEFLSHAVGLGSVRFIPSTWEQLPTLCHIVNTLADLPNLEPRGATETQMRCDTSLHNHRPLA